MNSIPTAPQIEDLISRHLSHLSPSSFLELRARETIALVTLVVAAAFSVPAHHFFTASRASEVVAARFAAWNILQRKKFTSTQMIAAYKRGDTGTIRHGIRRSRSLESAYPSYSNRIIECMAIIEKADGEAIEREDPLNALPQLYQDVLRATADAFEIHSAELFLGRRKLYLTEAQFAAALVLIDRGETYKQINHVLKRSESYAHAAYRYGRNRIKTDKNYARKVRSILQSLTNPEEQAA